jgi:hypothetical protein
MSAAVTQLTQTAVAIDPQGWLWNGLGFILTVLLIVLLAQKELVRAHDGPRTSERMRAFNLAIWPLSLAFVVIVVERVVGLLSHR